MWLSHISCGCLDPSLEAGTYVRKPKYCVTPDQIMCAEKVYYIIEITMRKNKNLNWPRIHFGLVENRDNNMSCIV